MRELYLAIRDALAEGDLLGHLAAWWRVLTGRVSPEDRVALVQGEEPTYV